MKYAVLAFYLLFTPLLQGQHRSYDVIEYDVDLTIDLGQRHIGGVVEITLRNTSRSPIDGVELDLRDNVVTSVTMGGSEVSWTQCDSTLDVTFPALLASLDTTRVTVAYGGSHPPVDPNGYATGVLFGPNTVSVKAQSSIHHYVSMTCHWLPCNNIFADRAIYDITFDVPAGYVAAGQGTLMDQHIGDVRSRFHWRLRDPLHPHTAGWAVGRYYRITDVIAGIPVEYYVLKSFHDRVREYFVRLPDMLATFESVWGPYPGEKIGFAMTDAGSLETHTMILLEAADMHDAATPQLEAHELAHHWFGNCVTPMDLRENWLSEGFAMYGEILYRANSLGRGRLDSLMSIYARNYMNGIANSEGIQPLYDYRGWGARFNYSSVIYIKGALVLNMLRHVMGDSLYHAGLQEYFRRYRYGNVTSTMFRDVMAGYAGETLEQYFDQWVYEPGWPILAAEQQHGDAADPLCIRVRQLQSARGWCLYELPMEVEIVTHAGQTLRVTRWVHEQQEDVLRINDVTNAEVASWRLDPDGYMLVQYADPTPVQSEPVPVGALRISSCYPQPCSVASGDALTIGYELSSPAHVQVELFDVLGRRVRKIESPHHQGGAQVALLPVTGLAPGSYTLQLHAGQERTMRMITLR
jgi:aminopeptidase N